MVHGSYSPIAVAFIGYRLFKLRCFVWLLF